MSGPQQNFERDALIAERCVTLAEIAELLVGDDAGTALLKAALHSWERQHGRDGALQLAGTVLIAVHYRNNADERSLQN